MTKYGYNLPKYNAAARTAHAAIFRPERKTRSRGYWAAMHWHAVRYNIRDRDSRQIAAQLLAR